VNLKLHSSSFGLLSPECRVNSCHGISLFCFGFWLGVKAHSCSFLQHLRNTKLLLKLEERPLHSTTSKSRNTPGPGTVVFGQIPCTCVHIHKGVLTFNEAVLFRLTRKSQMTRLLSAGLTCVLHAEHDGIKADGDLRDPVYSPGGEGH